MEERKTGTTVARPRTARWSVDLVRGEVSGSRELYELFDVQPGEALTMDWCVSRIHERDRAQVRARLEAAIAVRERFAERFTLVRADGALREVESEGEAVVAAGEVVGLVGSCCDVTDERALQLLDDAEQEVQRLLEREASLDDLLGVCAGLIAAVVPGARAVRWQVGGVWLGDACGDGDLACWKVPLWASGDRMLGALEVDVDREERTPAGLLWAERAGHVAAVALERHGLAAQLAAVAARLEEVRDEERTRIARELHDELGQGLTALKLDLAWIGRHAEEPQAIAARAGELAASIDALINSVRGLARELRCDLVGELGLVATIEWHLEELSKRLAIPCRLDAVVTAQATGELATAVVRIVQEALTNIARHARASEIVVELRVAPHELRVAVIDNGVGLPQPLPAGLGVLGMRERVRRLGGRLTLRPHLPRGTEVEVVVPVQLPATAGRTPRA